MKLQNKLGLQQITFNHSSDIEFQEFYYFQESLKKNAQQNYPLFCWLFVLLHQITPYALERIF